MFSEISQEGKGQILCDLIIWGNLKNNKNKKKKTKNKKEHQANRNRELVVARGTGAGE